MNLTFMGPFRFMFYELWAAFTSTMYFVLCVIFMIFRLNLDVKLNRFLMGLTEAIFGFSDQEARNFKRQKNITQMYFK